MDKQIIINNWNLYYKSYLELNQDLVFAGINSKKAALNHFIKYGYQEGRKIVGISTIQVPKTNTNTNINLYTNIIQDANTKQKVNTITEINLFPETNQNTNLNLYTNPNLNLNTNPNLNLNTNPNLNLNTNQNIIYLEERMIIEKLDLNV